MQKDSLRVPQVVERVKKDTRGPVPPPTRLLRRRRANDAKPALDCIDPQVEGRYVGLSHRIVLGYGEQRSWSEGLDFTWREQRVVGETRRVRTEFDLRHLPRESRRAIYIANVGFLEVLSSKLVHQRYAFPSVGACRTSNLNCGVHQERPAVCKEVKGK